MSLFVTRENQTLLWNIVNKNDKINNAFEYNVEEKQLWFKNIIQQFHEDKYQVYNVGDLKELNKTVLHYMVQDVKKRLLYYNQNQVPQQEPTHQMMEDQQQTIPNVEEEYSGMSDYERREQEYRKLLENPQPKSIDFSDGNREDALGSQELEYKIKERENDIINVKNPLVEENRLLNDKMEKMQKTMEDMQKTMEDMQSEINQIIVKQEVSYVIDSAVNNMN